MNELRECPFCGGTAELLEIPSEEHIAYCVHCPYCDTYRGDADMVNYCDYDEVVDKWNTRAPDPRLQEAMREIEELEQAGRFGNGMAKSILCTHIPESREGTDA